MSRVIVESNCRESRVKVETKSRESRVESKKVESREKKS